MASWIRKYKSFVLISVLALVAFPGFSAAESNTMPPALYQLARKQGEQIERLAKKMERALKEQQDILTEIQKSKIWLG